MIIICVAVAESDWRAAHNADFSPAARQLLFIMGFPIKGTKIPSITSKGPKHFGSTLNLSDVSSSQCFLPLHQLVFAGDCILCLHFYPFRYCICFSVLEVKAPLSTSTGKV